MWYKQSIESIRYIEQIRSIPEHGSQGGSPATESKVLAGQQIDFRDQRLAGDHFNLPGHSLANVKITILEQVKKLDIMYRKEREKYFINKFNTYHQGLNREK